MRLLGLDGNIMKCCNLFIVVKIDLVTPSSSRNALLLSRAENDSVKAPNPCKLGLWLLANTNTLLLPTPTTALHCFLFLFILLLLLRWMRF